MDAVVLPAPLLLYYAAHEGKGRVKTVGPEFNTAPAAIMVQLDSPLRRKINLALIALRENGTYQQIYDKWFGTPPLGRAKLKRCDCNSSLGRGPAVERVADDADASAAVFDTCAVA